MMGFDKRNPHQKPLNSLSTSPKAGTVSKPYITTQKPGASPVVLAALNATIDSSPNLKELGGVTWTDGTKASSSSSQVSDNNNEYVDKFLGIPPPIQQHPSDDEISLLSSQRNLFGGVPSRLSPTTDNNTTNNVTSSQIISDDVQSLSDSPRDVSNKESIHGDQPAVPDHSLVDEPLAESAEMLGLTMTDNESKPNTPVGLTGSDPVGDINEMINPNADAEGVEGDMALLDNNVSVKEIPFPEQRNGGSEKDNSNASNTASSSSAKHVTIIDTPAGAVDGGGSGVGAPNSLFSAYSQSVGGAQWSHPNLLQRGISSMSYMTGGDGSQSGNGVLPNMQDMTTEVLRLQFALNVGQRKGRPLRHVAGSQFRNHVTATLQVPTHPITALIPYLSHLINTPIASPH